MLIAFFINFEEKIVSEIFAVIINEIQLNFFIHESSLQNAVFYVKILEHIYNIFNLNKTDFFLDLMNFNIQIMLDMF